MDPISDMLIAIKNASAAKKETAAFPYSKVKHSILECLEKQGFIKQVSKKSQKGFPILEMLKGFPSRLPGFIRVSKNFGRSNKVVAPWFYQHPKEF